MYGIVCVSGGWGMFVCIGVLVCVEGGCVCVWRVSLCVCKKCLCLLLLVVFAYFVLSSDS